MMSGRRKFCSQQTVAFLVSLLTLYIGLVFLQAFADLVQQAQLVADGLFDVNAFDTF